MMIKVRFQDEAVAEAAEARYRRSDFSLDYRHRRAAKVHPPSPAQSIDRTLGIQEGVDFMIIADTLVVVFASETKELIAFDAYTNWEQWTMATGFALPRLSGAGRICLVDPLPEERCDISVAPVYTYSKDECLLEISLDREQEGSNYYRVSNRLVVGVRRGILVSLLVQQLELA